VAQDAEARLVVLDRERHVGETDIKREWRFCWRKTGGYHTLVIDASYGGGYGDIVQVWQVALAGPWAAWTTTDVASAGRYGSTPRPAASIRNLGGGKANVTRAGTYGACGIHDLALAQTGIAAWQTDCHLPSTSRTTYAVQAANGHSRTSATLDTEATTFGPDPFSAIQIRRCQTRCSRQSQSTVRWKRNGVWRSASAP
jgi:hypothetical protein